MQVPLQAPLRRLLFASATLIFIAIYLFAVVRVFLAHRLADKGEFQAAIKLAPGNAEYHRRLGLTQLFSQTDPQRSIDSLTTSVVLNPFSSGSWLSLATAYQMDGDSERQRQSIQSAIKIDPTTPQVAWEAAVFYGASGRVDESLRYLRVVAQYDDPSLPLETAWKLTHDADKVLLSSIPNTVPAHLAFLRMMVSNNEFSGAEKTWHHLINMGQQFDPKSAMFYVQYLLEHNDGRRARDVWRDMATVGPGIAQHNLPPNLITNAGFEEELLNGGLGWRFKPTSGVTLALDTTIFHAGAHALAISFDGEANYDAGVSQFIPVEPSTHYEFTGYTKGDQISTANGPYLSVAEGHDMTELARTAEFAGTYPWKPVSLEFQTGPGTSIVVLSLRRNPGSTRIRGRLWLDELSLVQK